MKKILIAILMFASLGVLNGATYYVATTGNDSYTTTQAQNIGTPWLTWEHAFSQLAAGDILNIRGGTYYVTGSTDHSPTHGACLYNRDGTSGSHITIQAYQEEIPILDGTDMEQTGQKTGVLFSYSSYIDIIGLTIMYVNEQAVTNDGPTDGTYIGDSDHITFTECIVTRCGTGFRVNGCNEIYFTNCDAFENADLEFGNYSSGGAGGYCDGFGVHNLSTTGHIYFTGCRAWNNSDDGWDCTSSNGYVTITDCWAFENGHMSGAWTTTEEHSNIDDITGDGDGFKIGVISGVKQSGTQRIFRNCASFNNDLMGFDESADYEAKVAMELFNCISYSNGNIGFGFYQSTGSGIVTIVNCISYDNTTNINLRTSVIKTTNSWQVATITDADFVSVTPTGVTGARVAGNLPVLTFLHLASGSDCIAAGTNVGITYDCDREYWYSTPSIGAFEYPQTEPTLPIMGNYTISTYTQTTITAGGIILDDGGASITDKGICWSHSINPTTADSHTHNGTGMDQFDQVITALDPLTFYWTRSFATNSEGTAYGFNIGCTLLCPILTIKGSQFVIGPGGKIVVFNW